MPVTAAVDVLVVVAVVKTLINVLCTVDRRLLRYIAWCTLMGKVQSYEPCKKKDVLVSRALLDPEVEASQEFRRSCDQRKSIRYVRLSEMLI